jgi:hypothetical protein
MPTQKATRMNKKKTFVILLCGYVRANVNYDTGITGA